MTASVKRVLAFGVFACLSLSDAHAQEKFSLEYLNLYVSAGQVVEVRQESAGSSQAVVTAYERKEKGELRSVLGPFDAVIGRNGLAPIEGKREGDGKTPSGIYPIGVSFGYDPSIATKLDYRQVDQNDLWIDEPQSPDYNRWVRAPTDAKSFEYLKRDDNLYEVAVVIEYNTNPIVPGNGSAIFMHVYRNIDTPTAGCVALAKDDLLKILGWLDKNKKPIMILGIYE